MRKQVYNRCYNCLLNTGTPAPFQKNGKVSRVTPKFQVQLNKEKSLNYTGQQPYGTKIYSALFKLILIR
jgi:hypothetical protein